MKKTLYLLMAAAALMAGLTACESKEDKGIDEEDIIDLRYRVESQYDLDAVSAKPFTIVVKSSHPWTIRSYHPDWCIIEQEDGEAVDPELVHVGKGESTSVKVQYYDNTSLDDRIDYIEIASGDWIGKKVTVYQKGIAYLRVPEADIEGGLDIEKAGGELTIHVNTNQKWSAKIVPEGDGSVDWLDVTEGATGELDGTATITVEENTGEKRYANVAVYDRNGEERAMIKITQDGVQLDPETFEVRVSYDQNAATLAVISNARWTAETDADWFTIDNPDGHDGDGTLNLTVKDNDTDALRKGEITLKTVAANEGDPIAEKTVVVKQSYMIEPVRRIVNNDELGAWSSDWANAPTYTQDVGTLFAAKARLNRSMDFGTYTFRWKNWAGGARIRHWFCFSEGCELKFDIRPVDVKIGFDFNAAGDGNKPSLSAYTDIDWTKPIEITYKFDPSGSQYCHVTYLVKQDGADAAEAGSFDTSENLLRTVTWNAKINMYVGVDQVSDQAAGSAILEWYEYTAPMNWDEE